MKFQFNKKEYRSSSNVDTQKAIKFIKDKFQKYLSKNLNLLRVSAPIFVEAVTGLNDDLNGIERKVSFTPLFDDNARLEVVQSLAKWKRHALKKYGIKTGHGIYTDMNAIRRDETLDQIHSLYVDQWDWEKCIKASDRNVKFLKKNVLLICDALDKTIKDVKKIYKIFIWNLIKFHTSSPVKNYYKCILSFHQMKEKLKFAKTQYSFCYWYWK